MRRYVELLPHCADPFSSVFIMALESVYSIFLTTAVRMNEGDQSPLSAMSAVQCYQCSG